MWLSVMKAFVKLLRTSEPEFKDYMIVSKLVPGTKKYSNGHSSAILHPGTKLSLRSNIFCRRRKDFVSLNVALMWHLQYVAKKSLRSYPNTSFRFLKLRLRGFMIIKPLQKGLPELLREATRSGQTF